MSDYQLIIRAGDRVVLAQGYEALAAGMCGTVLAVFRRAAAAYVIGFDAGGVHEVPAGFVRRADLAA